MKKMEKVVDWLMGRVNWTALRISESKKKREEKTKKLQSVFANLQAKKIPISIINQILSRATRSDNPCKLNAAEITACCYAYGLTKKYRKQIPLEDYLPSSWQELYNNIAFSAGQAAYGSVKSALGKSIEKSILSISCELLNFPSLNADTIITGDCNGYTTELTLERQVDCAILHDRYMTLIEMTLAGKANSELGLDKCGRFDTDLRILPLIIVLEKNNGKLNNKNNVINIFGNCLVYELAKWLHNLSGYYSPILDVRNREEWIRENLLRKKEIMLL